MTATILDAERGAFSGDIIAGIRANGIVPVPAGTLWERAAETPSNAPAQLTARQDEAILRAYDYASIRAHRGPLARDPFSVASIQGVQSGTFRAGVRIK